MYGETVLYGEIICVMYGETICVLYEQTNVWRDHNVIYGQTNVWRDNMCDVWRD